MAKRKSTNNDLQNIQCKHKTKDRVTRTPLKTSGELRCSGRVSSSSDTRRVNLVTNPVISHEWGKDWEVFTRSGTYPWSFVTQIFYNGQPSHGGYRKISQWWLQLSLTQPLFSIFSYFPGRICLKNDLLLNIFHLSI